MKITKTKIKRELEKNYGWNGLTEKDYYHFMIDELISDTLKIVNDILMKQKGVS